MFQGNISAPVIGFFLACTLHAGFAHPDSHGTHLAVLAAKLDPPSSTKVAKGGSNDANPILVIELHGEVGIDPTGIDDPKTSSYTAAYLQRQLERAQKRGASAVVLDIDGPGGLVVEMQRMVDVILKAQRDDDLRLIAVTRRALSAWSRVALACREIVVTPGSKVGAAVTIVVANGEVRHAPVGKDAVSQKREAPWQATLRDVHRLTGRCACIMEAMGDQQSQLWWSPTSGLAAVAGAGSDWECLDDDVRVCCLTDDEMLKTGIAVGRIKELKELAEVLKIPTERIEIMNKGDKACLFAERVKDLHNGLDRAKKHLELSIRLDEDGNEHLECGMLRMKAKPQAVDIKVSDPNVIGGTGSRRITVERSEIIAEAKDRMRHALLAAKRSIPEPKLFNDSPEIAEDLHSIRQSLDAARNAAGKADWEDVVEETIRAGVLICGLRGR